MPTVEPDLTRRNLRKVNAMLLTFYCLGLTAAIGGGIIGHTVGIGVLVGGILGLAVAAGLLLGGLLVASTVGGLLALWPKRRTR